MNDEVLDAILNERPFTLLDTTAAAAGRLSFFVRRSFLLAAIGLLNDLRSLKR